MSSTDSHIPQLLVFAGPNGSGKSTLSKVIMGHPAYKVDKGSVELDGKNLLEMEISERANSGRLRYFSIMTARRAFPSMWKSENA